MKSKKELRSILEYDFESVEKDSNRWIENAREFSKVAEMIYAINEDSPPYPFYYNAGIATELYLKGTILNQNGKLVKQHHLVKLAEDANLTLTSDQVSLLEILSETVIWFGRYPTPRNSEVWDKFHDEIYEKHKIRETNGNTHVVRANLNTFPTIENCKKIWDACETEIKNA
ncbi:MAG: hypothetical protein CENE_00594 [Candidatus Celerinatantimonas neptuna]|nr:MAG: hypothetical protein CENE_00594 [Candidatus Celerinatantimonas neptuna]